MNEPALELALSNNDATHRLPSWLWPVVSVAVLLTALLSAWVSGFLISGSGEGFLILNNLPANAVVKVDGDRSTIESANGVLPKLRLRPGRRVVEVKRGEHTLVNQPVTIEPGRTYRLTMNTEPSAHSTAASIDGAKSREVSSPSLKKEDALGVKGDRDKN